MSSSEILILGKLALTFGLLLGLPLLDLFLLERRRRARRRHSVQEDEDPAALFRWAENRPRAARHTAVPHAKLTALPSPPAERNRRQDPARSD